MHALAWILTGVVAGWLTGYALKGRGYGLLGNLLIGLSGGLVGGWIFHSLGVTASGNLAEQVLVALVGSVVLVMVVRTLHHAARQAGSFATQARAAAVTSDLEGQIKRLAGLERAVLAKFLGRAPVAKDPNVVYDAQLTFGERVADQVAAFGGSWTFIGLFAATLVLWLWVNARAERPFDPYPFILLNLVLSCLAALQAPVIMMSQNRQAVKDRLDAQSDYQVNLKAEMEILALHAKLDELRQTELQELIDLQQRHQVLMERLERLLRIHEQ